MDEINVPKSTSADSLLGLVKASIDVAPGGSLLSFALQQFLQAPLDKRMQAFFEQVAQKLNDHSKQIEDLASNDRFISTLLQAANIALRNHNEEKLESLRNAVVNSINPPSYDESLHTVFLNLIDRFTAWHLKVLVSIRESSSDNGSLSHLRSLPLQWRLLEIYPSFHEQREFLALILVDLEAAFLIEDTSKQRKEFLNPESYRVTGIGFQFISFIGIVQLQ